VLVLTACTHHDRSDEARKLTEEMIEMADCSIDQVMQRVDSAQQAGLFSAVRANTVKAYIYEYAGQEQFGDDRLLDILRNTHFDNARQVIQTLQAEVEHYRNGAEPNDDLTMMCIRVS
jgi:hypothetical protein